MGGEGKERGGKGGEGEGREGEGKERGRERGRGREGRRREGGEGMAPNSNSWVRPCRRLRASMSATAVAHCRDKTWCCAVHTTVH